jgi:hypothetical protein
MDWAPPEEKKFGLGDTWPAQLAKTIYRAVTLPGEGYQGKLAVQPEKPGWITEGDIANQDAVDQDIIHRSFDLAGVASPASAGSKAVVAPPCRVLLHPLRQMKLLTPPAAFLT